MSARSMEFFDVWDTYKKVVAGDYMFHNRIGEALKRAIAARFAPGACSLLDLGCGDVSALLPLLRELPPARYKGVDLSETALALAARNLEPLPFAKTLMNADLLAALAAPEQYDAIYSSFAVHHLVTEQKAEFFRRAARRLAPGGLLLLVDVVREEDETLAVYQQRYTDWLRASWTGLAPREREAVCDHLVNNDLPEPFSVLEAQARDAGLATTPGGERCGWHRLMCFSHA